MLSFHKLAFLFHLIECVFRELNIPRRTGLLIPSPMVAESAEACALGSDFQYVGELLK